MRLASFVLVVSLSASVAASSHTACSDYELRNGTCSVTAGIDGDEAYVGGSREGAGSGGSGNSAGGDAGGTPPAPAPEPPPRCSVGYVGCSGLLDGTEDEPVVVVTLSDIARFRPAPGIQRMEPDGWVVVGLPANIYSLVDTQIVPGELLGRSADVRFTPVGWRWDYGDGTTAALSTKGATWAAQGLREFDATPTSHIYRQAGSYTIRLSIVYRAEYRIAGGPFTPIVGTITLPANELHITASGAKTVLVDRDCTVAPRGPGC